jgi:hypothetical protein
VDVLPATIALIAEQESWRASCKRFPIRETNMTWKDKLELGLKNDAPFRKDNLPEQQVRGPEVPAGPGRSPIIPAAIEDVAETPDPVDHEAEHEEDEKA